MSVQNLKKKLLKQVWGFDEFRGNQEEIIDCVLSSNDTLALMATGGGKSLCYQLPALISSGICIVISPLIALMEDQELSLKKKGIKALSIHSGKSTKIQDELFDNCIYGDYKFLFLSPEKLNSDISIARIQQMNVSFFVIDEAHCISQWGHDFRPAYLKLKIIKEIFPASHILALTATATNEVVQDIIEYLDFNSSYKLFRSTFFRPNISISVMKTVRKLKKIEQFVKKIRGSKIIYARNKRHCTEINTQLQKNGIRSEIYHADIPVKIRLQRQISWVNNEIECMVCTSAFGMGIDKPDVRLVVHYDLPPSLEEYIQEIGRAGRDGEKSYAVLLFHNYDLQELEFHYLNSIPKVDEIKEIYHQLGTFLNIPLGDGLGSSFNLDLESFILRLNVNKVFIKAAFQTLEKNEYILVNDTIFARDKLHIIAGKQVLNDFLHSESDLALLVKILLRTYEGLLYGFVSISIEKLMGKLSWNEEKIFGIINLGIKQLIFKFEHEEGSNKIYYLKERLPKSNIAIDKKALNQFYKAKKKRYESVIDYVTNNTCRSIELLNYFGEIKKVNCGICDFCMGAFEEKYSIEEYNAASHLILSNLIKSKLELEEILELWTWNNHNKMKSILKSMLDAEIITYNKGYFSFIFKQ